MFKEYIRIKNNIFYSPSHNIFVPPEFLDQFDSEKILLEISGNEEKIFEFLISNYNNFVSRETLEEEFPECTEPYNKILDRLRRDKIEGILKLYGLITKKSGKVILYLSESPFSPEEKAAASKSQLLYRKDYYVDYDRLLADFSPNDKDAPQSILYKWIEDCSKQTSYDKRCLMILECIGFLPAFGQKSDKKWFLNKVKELIYSFKEQDITEYSGTEPLLFTRSVITAICEYIQAQLEIIIPDDNNKDLQSVFEKILQTFSTIDIPDDTTYNPLLLVAYYHYFGLANYRNYLYTHNNDFLISARRKMESAIQNAQKVDMHLQIWKAFLTYDLGRVYSELNEYEKAIKNIQIAVDLRYGLAYSPFFSDSIKHELYFEYLLAKIVQVDIKKKCNELSDDKALNKYAKIKEETKQIYGDLNSDSSQSYLYRLLSNRMQ